MSLSRAAGSAIIAGVHPHVDLVAAGSPQFEAALASFVTGNRLAGGVAGVVYGDELAWSAGAGFADQAARQASDPAMLYAIASITKTFTGTAIMQLRDAGRLDLDDPAVAWLPELRQAASPFSPIETVTLRRMLSHESGLAAEPPGTDWAIPAYPGDPEQTLRRPARSPSRSRRTRSTSTPTSPTSCSAPSSPGPAASPTRTTCRRRSCSRWA